MVQFAWLLASLTSIIVVGITLVAVHDYFERLFTTEL